LQDGLRADLSGFCKALTSIRQEHVDAAETFPVVLSWLVDWAQPAPPAVAPDINPEVAARARAQAFLQRRQAPHSGGS
jgi:inhibitor of KinA sporulation pathway (predicted exonuclease)